MGSGFTRIKGRVVRTLGVGLALGGAAQVVAAASVVGIDVLRKRRSTRPPHFPHAAPATTRVAGSEVTTYTRGVDVYADMLEAIRSARDSVYFESFIFKGDDTGKAFKESLVAAADRGVDVYVVFDGFANLVVDPRFYRFPSSVHVLRFPVVRRGMFHLDLRHFGRDHRKVLVVDHEVGFVGGYNVGDLYGQSWRDTHVRVDGPATWELEDAFVDFWNEHAPRSQPRLPDHGARSWDSRIEVARNAPSRLLFPVRGLYLGAIERASRRVYITQAYFIPDAEILETLLKAAARGVDVKVIVPEYSNHVLADWAARTYYDRLLDGGVEIWLYRNAMMHAKTATVDGLWSTIGTANIDRLSMIGNYEVNLALFSDAVAGRMEEIFEMDLSNCSRLTAEEWSRRGRLPRVAEKLLGPLGPLL